MARGKRASLRVQIGGGMCAVEKEIRRGKSRNGIDKGHVLRPCGFFSYF